MPLGNQIDPSKFDSAMASNDPVKSLSNRLIARAGVMAAAIVLSATLAAAQDAAKPAPRQQQDGFFGTISRWWDQTTETWNSGVGGVRKRFETFGTEAGVAARVTVDNAKSAADAAARATVDNAKSAADAVARIPNARVVRGHEKCKIAPNGAPDCIAATVALCKSKGFDNGGSSLDMTTAEICPAQVYLSGRTEGEGCHTETFVSRVLCQ
jgi:hypothetical protein